MSEQNSTKDGDEDAQHSLYMVFLVVLVFFVMGLLGFLVCHVLKKKGYRCRTFHDELDLDNKESLAQLQDDEDDELNEDTVEKIVKCIIQNEANVEVLKEMLADGEGEVPAPVPVPLPSLCPHRNSQDGGVPHHHTVHLGSTQAPCMHCSQKKRHPLHRQGRSKEGKAKMHPGETTVFSVGRFHVTHIVKKPASQEASLPDSKQDLDSADVDQESHSNEKLQWEGSQNGIFPMDRLWHGRSQQADTQSERGQLEDCPGEQTQGEHPSDPTDPSDVPTSGSEGQDHPKTGSSQETGRLCTAMRKTSDQTLLGTAAEHFVSEEMKALEKLDTKSDAFGDEVIQKETDEATENEGSQIIQGETSPFLSVKEASRTKSIGQQEQSAVVQDPGVCV